MESIHVPSRERMRGVHAIDPNLFPIEDPQAEGGTPLVYPSEQANSLGYNNAYNSQYQPNWKNHPNLSWSNPNNFANPSHFYPSNQTAQNSQAALRSKPSNQSYRPPNSSSQPFQPPPS